MLDAMTDAAFEEVIQEAERRMSLSEALMLSQRARPVRPRRLVVVERNPLPPADVRPLLETVYDLLKTLESAWVSGKSLKGSLGRVQDVRQAVERALAVESHG